MPSESSRFESVSIEDVTVVRTTEKALLIQPPGGKEHWIPKSQIKRESDIDEDSGEEDVGTLVIPRWLAEGENLV